MQDHATKNSDFPRQFRLAIAVHNPQVSIAHFVQLSRFRLFEVFGGAWWNDSVASQPQRCCQFVFMSFRMK